MTSLAELHRERDASYVEYFEFLELPFPDSPGPRFECGTQSRARVLEGVISDVDRREGLIVVTGDEGTGKTTLCLALPQHFGPRTFSSVILKAPPAPGDLLRQLLVDFGLIEPQPAIGVSSRHDLYVVLQGFLLSLAPLQGHAVLVIDEAHALSAGVLEEILRLSSFEEYHPGLFQMVLVGRPPLLDVLQQPGVSRLFDRMVRRHALPPFTDAEVAPYIERQIWIARGGVEAVPAVTDLDRASSGSRRGSGPRFTPSAVDLIAGRSSGNPRAINLICERALAMARDRATDRITGRLARRAAADLGLRNDGARLRWRSPKGASVMVATLAAGALAFGSWQNRWPLHTATSIETLSLSPDQPFEEFRSEALRLGTSLSVEPDVKQLLRLQDEVHLWDINTKYASHRAVEGLLVELQRLTDEARQRQLELDRALILDASGKRVP